MMKQKGGYNAYSIQPNRAISEKNDGTLEGSATFKTDRARFNTLPQLRSPHPDDRRLECYQRSLVYGNNDEVTLTASYFGLVSSKTDLVVSFSGGQNNDPIQTHPDFKSFATKENGAVFESDGSFVGFSEGDLLGLTHYLTPATMISVSFWTNRKPSLKNRLSVVSRAPGVSTPPGVKNFLMLDTPYRQVGSFYQVTEQYLGSGKKGWNTTVYN